MASDPPPLLFGPYRAPDVSTGWLDDEIDGLTEVGGWTHAPIPWPRRRKSGRPSLILCGDLIRAVQQESSAAVQHHWGVGPVTVWRWRQALGVGRVTPGTRERLRTETGVPPEAAARGREAASTPDARARIAEAKRGVPAPPATRAALLAAAKRPKPPEWGKRANQWMQAAKCRDRD